MIDVFGNAYIADYGNHRVRKVDSTGIISTVAGTGSHDFSGDGTPAVIARREVQKTAGILSPLKPATPVPATVVMIPLESTFLTR